eukprot:NODE_127_length_18646_cov_0.421632.p12 type:complete len:111 gc:universal NODE_127_length_18646_cov_0.421632:10464-10132(-)
MKPVKTPLFDEEYEKMGNLVKETYLLTVCKTIDDLIVILQRQWHMSVCEGGEYVSNKNKHLLKMSGIVYGGIKVMAMVRMVIELGVGVNVELQIKSDLMDISQLIADSLG